MNDTERQLLEYLASKKDGRALICSPALVYAVRDLRHGPYLSDVYSAPDGKAVTARITEAGRAALSEGKGQHA